MVKCRKLNYISQFTINLDIVCKGFLLCLFFDYFLFYEFSFWHLSLFFDWIFFVFLLFPSILRMSVLKRKECTRLTRSSLFGECPPSLLFITCHFVYTWSTNRNIYEHRHRNKLNHSFTAFVQHSSPQHFFKMLETIWGWSYYAQCASSEWSKNEKFYFRFCEFIVNWSYNSPSIVVYLSSETSIILWIVDS